MKILDKIFFGLLFSAALPIAFFMIGWRGTIGRVPENMIFIYALAGLLLGIILNFFFIRKIISNLYDTNASNLIIIYIFYSVCCFGFFMGVPVFNILLGIPAGYYAAMKCIYLRRTSNISELYFRQVSVFTSIMMFLASAASAIIALSDPFTGRNINDMLGLNIDITKTILLIIIVVGGAMLIIIQYFLTNYSAKMLYKFFNKEAEE